MSNPAIDIASTLQFASIKRDPSPAHDINPSTAASIKRPVSPTTSISSNAESIPESVLKPAPRRANLPPLPDLRFEQSYLASLKGVESARAIAWITVRDQAGDIGTRALSTKEPAGEVECGVGGGVSTIGQYLKRKLDEKMAQDMGDLYGDQIGTAQGG